MTNIYCTGNLTITRKDLNGNILDVDNGSNLILNSGLGALTKLVSGQIAIPTNPTAGFNLNVYTTPVPYLPYYVQFGTSSIAPSPTDVSVHQNGTLDANTVSPVGASPILRCTTYNTATNSIVFQAVLPPNQGNGPSGSGITYREAVLMSYDVASPPKYSWFARRVFSDKFKDSSVIIEVEWTLTFATREA